MKGVILAGGSGTRLHPLTRITNKHLLPLYDRPMVTYAVEALVRAGIDEVMLVTGGTHAGEFFRLLGNGHEHGIDRLFYAYQEEAGGIAEALGLAERFVGRDKVCVLLADNVFEHSLRPIVENFARQSAGARIVLSNVAEDEHLRHLGVARMDGDRVVEIVEKPESPPSHVRGHRRLLLRRPGVGRAPDADAVGPRRARDHRREQLVRRRAASWRQTSSKASGATRASRSTRTTR